MTSAQYRSNDRGVGLVGQSAPSLTLPCERLCYWSKAVKGLLQDTRALLIEIFRQE